MENPFPSINQKYSTVAMPKFNFHNKSIEIPLFDRTSKVTGYALVSWQDGEELLKYTYSIEHDNRSKKGYVHSSLGPLLSHLVLGKPDAGFVVDHRNGDTIDNRRENLAFLTHSQNAQNKKKKKGTSSKYIGVSKAAGNTKWRACIHKSKTYNLGDYDDEEQAAKVYDVYAFYFFGKTAMSNNLLTETEISFIILNNKILPGFERPGDRKGERVLPDNIYRTSNGISYRYREMKNTERVEFTSKLLEDCITKKEETRKRWAEEDRLTEEIHLYNPLIINNLYVIPVSSGERKVGFIVDSHVWIDVFKFSWSLNPSNYAQAYIEGKTTLMHRYIWTKYVGDIPEGTDLTIDHKRSNMPYDARLENLRLVPKSVQSHNKRRNNKNLDKYKGVYFDGHSFRVIIGKNYYGA